MKFLVDAQLPPLLKSWLIERGHDCVHALDLPQKDRTTDDEIIRIVAEQGLILISKDTDFLKLKLLLNKPEKLLLITTGNLRNADLAALFESNFESVMRLFQTFELVELGNSFVIGRNTTNTGT